MSTEHKQRHADALAAALLQLENKRAAWPSQVWSCTDQQRAYTEGWAIGIFVAGAHNIRRPVPEILHRHKSDSEAAEYVRQRAQEGSEFHQRALAIHIGQLMGLPLE